MQPSLKKNSVYRILYEVLKVVTPFITAPYIARVLEADGVGNYSYTHSIITYFMLFAALGTVGYGTREIAQSRDDKEKASKLFWEIEILSIITTCVCLVVWIGFIIFTTEFKLLYIALTPFLLSTLFDISWFFTGYEKIKDIVVRNSIIKILGVVALFVFVKSKEDLWKYCLINSMVMLLGNLSMWFYLPKMLAKVNFREIRLGHHFHETLIYFIPAIAISIYTYLDKTLIRLITQDAYQNGYYEEASKILGIVNSVAFMAVNSVMGARTSYLFANNKTDEIKEKIRHTVDFVYLIGFGAVFGLLGVARRFVPLFLGPNYDQVVPLLSVMTPLIVIIGTSNCLGSLYYTPSGQRKKSAKIIVLGAITNLCLNLLLIPRFGAYGAIIASIAAESLITIIYVQLSAGFLKWGTVAILSYKRIIAGVLMFVAVYITGRWLTISDIYVIIIQIVFGLAIYGTVLLIERDTMAYELIDICKNVIVGKLKKRSMS